MVPAAHPHPKNPKVSPPGLQPSHQIYQNSKSASKLMSVTRKGNAQKLWREGINNTADIKIQARMDRLED